MGLFGVGLSLNLIKHNFYQLSLLILLSILNVTYSLIRAEKQAANLTSRFIGPLTAKNISQKMC